jgi:hypothetical protein
MKDKKGGGHAAQHEMSGHHDGVGKDALAHESHKAMNSKHGAGGMDPAGGYEEGSDSGSGMGCNEKKY